MNISPEIQRAAKELSLSYPHYTPESYQFVADSVSYTIGKLHSHRQISALELLEGIREFAFTEFGAVAPQVLASLGLCGARNVGEVVYLLISVKLLSDSPEDSPEDFNLDFSWEEAPQRPSKGNKLPFLDVD